MFVCGGGAGGYCQVDVQQQKHWLMIPFIMEMMRGENETYLEEIQTGVFLTWLEKKQKNNEYGGKQILQEENHLLWLHSH